MLRIAAGETRGRIDRIIAAQRKLAMLPVSESGLLTDGFFLILTFADHFDRKARSFENSL